MRNSSLCEATLRRAEVDRVEVRPSPPDAADVPRIDVPRVASNAYLPVKFVVEWLLALGLLLATAPLLGALAAAVRATSPGPAFYAQTRLGRSGRLYKIYKLRTMRQDAETGTGPVWAARDDDRITPIGRLLRDTHMDELPQLLNVLFGQMALIGPRPERPELAARVASRLPAFYHRLQVRPGVTGLAQMLLPADDPNDHAYDGVRRKLDHDFRYIRGISPSLDLKIAVSTSCYFCGAAVEAVRMKLLRPYGPAGDAAAAGVDDDAGLLDLDVRQGAA